MTSHYFHQHSSRVFFTLLTAGLLWACSTPSPESSSATEDSVATEVTITAEQMATIGIRTAAAEERVVPDIVQATGMLDVPPQNLVTVAAVMPGFVEQTSLLQGMRVKKGQTLVTLRHPDYIQLQQDFLETETQFELARLEQTRQEDLASENINAGKTLQQARAEFGRLSARLQGITARLKMINIDPASLKQSGIRNTITILSPISGYVTEVMVNTGMYVAPEKAMFRIVDTEHLHAELQVFEQDILKLKEGQLIRWKLVNDAAERTAHVYLIGKEISGERTVRVHGHLDKHDPELLPGMYFSAIIEVEAEKSSTLPESAFQSFEGIDYVFSAVANGKFRIVRAKKGACVSGVCRFTLENESAQGQFAVSGTRTLLGLLKNVQESD